MLPCSNDISLCLLCLLTLAEKQRIVIQCHKIYHKAFPYKPTFQQVQDTSVQLCRNGWVYKNIWGKNGYYATLMESLNYLSPYLGQGSDLPLPTAKRHYIAHFPSNNILKENFRLIIVVSLKYLFSFPSQMKFNTVN